VPPDVVARFSVRIRGAVADEALSLSLEGRARTEGHADVVILAGR
jgi:hypothetical protein